MAFVELDVWGSIPTQFQYFSDPTIGGSDGSIDYCPFGEQ
jgi:hypothetical protein